MDADHPHLHLVSGAPRAADAVEICLHAAGYEARFHQGAWTECLIAGHGEAWLGRGLDRTAAREDALRQMLPSKLARRLFEDAAAPARAEPQEQQALAQRGDAATVDAAVPLHEPVVDGPAGEAPPPEPPADGEALSPRLVPEPEVAAAVPADPPRGEASAEPPAAAVVVAPARTKRPILCDVFGAHEALDDLVAEMRDAADDVPLCAPDRLRLEMSVWLCRARAIQDGVGDDGVFSRVRAEIAVQLTRWAKTYWPGNLPALRLTATPDEMAAFLGGSADSWDDAAELAERHLEQAPGDGYGWPEPDDAIVPPHPGSILGEARKIIGEALPFDAELDTDVLRDAGRRLGQAGIDKARLVHAARLLRWVRPVAPDPVVWGRCMGRLRWLAQYARLEQNAPLAVALDPQTSPAGGWAAVLGYDPKAQEHKRRRKELLLSRPTAGADEGKITAWFQRAAETLDADELAPVVAGFAPALLGLDGSEAYPGKALSRIRDRLRKVQRRLKQPASVTAPPVETVVLPDADEGDPGDASPVELARCLVAGQRALVVSNRADSHLQRHLEERLGLEVEWCDAEQRKTLAAACERVRRGSVDLVLALTGFMNHSDEGPLKDAARQANVVYVSSYKGRVLAASLAILRVHGRQADQATGSAPSAGIS